MKLEAAFRPLACELDVAMLEGGDRQAVQEDSDPVVVPFLLVDREALLP